VLKEIKINKAAEKSRIVEGNFEVRLSAFQLVRRRNSGVGLRVSTFADEIRCWARGNGGMQNTAALKVVFPPLRCCAGGARTSKTL
jgi:hypothetical protein